MGGDLTRQAEQTLSNVRGVLEAAGMGPENVVTCGVYLPDARDYGAMNEAYGKFLLQSAAGARHGPGAAGQSGSGHRDQL